MRRSRSHDPSLLHDVYRFAFFLLYIHFHDDAIDFSVSLHDGVLTVLCTDF